MEAASNEISFDRAKVVTPTGATLVQDLTLRVPSGTNLLVTGPNGSGKSSLFRCASPARCPFLLRLSGLHGVKQIAQVGHAAALPGLGMPGSRHSPQGPHHPMHHPCGLFPCGMGSPGLDGLAAESLAFYAVDRNWDDVRSLCHPGHIFLLIEQLLYQAGTASEPPQLQLVHGARSWPHSSVSPGCMATNDLHSHAIEHANASAAEVPEVCRVCRVLGGLWPLTDGIVRKPGGATGGLAADIFYVPQRPYVTIGSLQDQLVYPIERAGTSQLCSAYPDCGS